MTWANYDDVVNQLVNGGLLIEGGIEVDTPSPRRVFEAGGDREKRGWYWLVSKEISGESYITGAYGIYHGNDNGKIAIKINRDGKAVHISAEDRAAIAARQKEHAARLKAMRQAQADKAAAAAARAWRAYSPDGASDYLQRKRVGAFGLRFAQSGALAVPMMDPAGKIHGLQIIRGKQRRTGQLEKEFWPKGLAMAGHYHLIGPVPGAVLLIAEGYATAATLHQATGLPVAVAFTAGNLLPVAETLHHAYKNTRLLICADDDYLTDGNPGKTAADRAAHAVGGYAITPRFTDVRPADKKGPTDFNDLAALEGEPTVRAQIEATLRSIGWQLEAPRPAALPAGGEGQRAAMDSIIQVDDAIERFSMIYGTGGTWFDRAEHMLIPKADLQDILPEHGMRDLRNRKHVVRLDEVGFDPTERDSKILCNLWAGWPTVPKAGNCTIILELLEYLCSNEDNPRAVYEWVLRWLAYPIQHPGAKMHSSLVFHGTQGTGKNLFCESIKAIYGPYGRIIDQNTLESQFTDWASKCLFVIADEVVARAELFSTKNRLKGIITGETIRINTKNVVPYDERNHMNVVFLSNEVQPLYLESSDRRHCVIWTPEKLGRDFYQEVVAEIAAGGIAALHDYLLNVDLGDFQVNTDPPNTRAKRDLIVRGLDSVARFINDWQAGEVIHGEEGKAIPFCPAGSAALYRIYLDWCKKNGETRPRAENQFSGEIVKLPGWFKGYKDRHKSYTDPAIVRQRFIAPSTEALDAAIKDGQANYKRKEGELAADYFTRCYFDFNLAAGL